MKLFILFTLPFLLLYGHTHGQEDLDFGHRSSKERRKLKKKVKSLPYEVKLSSFLCLYYNNRPTDESQIAGLVFENPETLSKHSNSFSKKEEIFLEYDGIHTYQDLPFPSKHAVDVNQLPGWLPGLFCADYLIDIRHDSAKILFYGIDSIGVFTDTTPYSSWDSLTSAIVSHDLIFYPHSYESFAQKLSENKLTKKDKRDIDGKYIKGILAENTPRELFQPQKPEVEVREWIWQATRKSIDLSSVAQLLPSWKLDSLTICSFNFRADEFELFKNELQRYVEVRSYGFTTEAETLKRLEAYDLVIIPISHLSPEETEFLNKLSSRTSLLLINFTDALSSNAFPTLESSSINVPDNNPLSQSLAGQVIFGAWKNKTCSQRLRYGTAALAKMNPSTLELIDSIVDEALKEQAIPGCQILVAKNGMVVFDKSYGYQTYDSLEKVNSKTLYDLASITKVLATTQGIMKLVEDGLISLDEPLSSYLPYLQSTNKSGISTRQIMAHQAGLYPYYPFWKKYKEEAKSFSSLQNSEVQVGKSLWVSESVSDSILSWVAKSDLLAERIDTITHEQYFYSDIGFYLLKDLIENKTHQSLDRYLAKALYKPLGTSLSFNPLCTYPAKDIAPTERDNQLRNELVQGYVHDRNAALLGGVSGQAGLFGTANDVAILLQLQLNGGCYGGQQYFKPETVKQFITRQYVNNRRGLGWDMPGDEPDGPVSELASNDTYGHTGFTGGSIWVDPKESLIFVFLSNRVYPSGTNTKLVDLNVRTRIQDIVYQAIIE